jgi:hypothetical protein
MALSIFLSRPRPHTKAQKAFLELICRYLTEERGLLPRTVGHTDYGVEPLRRIRSVLTDCNGLLTIAFQRIRVDVGFDRPTKRHTVDKGFRAQGPLEDVWFSSPYCHIETAMAFQMGLPILVIAEEGVRPEGVLEPGVLVGDIPTFDLDNKSADDFLDGEQWKQLVRTWEGQVREVSTRKGLPPKLYTW